MKSERAALVATYRLQLRKAFGFGHAAELCDYLAALGVSHAYFSPYLQAAPGSSHGYDVVDHTRVNDELGGDEGHRRLCEALASAGLGQVIDIVPNHMSIATHHNRWWWDVLENGPASQYAHYFDVDWRPPDERLKDKVLLPILGDHYGRVLESRQLALVRRGGSFRVRVYEQELPLAPSSLPPILHRASEHAVSDDLGFAADVLSTLPSPSLTDEDSAVRRHRDRTIVGRLLERIFQEQPDCARAVDRVIEELNRDPDQLDHVMEQQNYRLAFWRVARHDLDYRRFFDINTLAALRMGNERVFRDTHALPLRWVEQGVVDGLRVDHPDGLRDPERYFRRLREAAPDAWIVAEKILDADEELPERWPIDGTTGYDFLNVVNWLYVDSRAESAFTRFYAELTGEETDFEVVVRHKKRQVLRDLLASDLSRLTTLFQQVCEGRRRYRDYTSQDLRLALQETLAAFPVYRTYVRPGDPASVRDLRYIERAVEEARLERPDLDRELLDLLRDILSGRIEGELESHLVLGFQQLSGPAMAKGLEDTAFYNYNRLVSLCEVGGDPGRFGMSRDLFHLRSERIQLCWPATMNTLSTHDTKRSLDVRARISLLSQIPELWCEAVTRWVARSERLRRGPWPDRNVEYLLYQTLVGAWPVTFERLWGFMEKAVREAKTHTSWTAQNQEYEAALRGFVEGVLEDRELIADLEAFLQPLIEPARVTALAQVLLHMTAPGVPDVYQGNELWDHSLTDPDNRRPVDYGLRRRLLEEVKHLSAEEILARSDEGLPKLWVIHRSLMARKDHADAFGRNGGYGPIRPAGRHGELVVAFTRGGKVTVVVPRLVLLLREGWDDTSVSLAPGRHHNLLTGETLEGGEVGLERLLERFPVALLARQE